MGACLLCKINIIIYIKTIYFIQGRPLDFGGL